MASEFIEFPCELGVGAAVLLDGVENRDAVDGDGDGALEEACLRGNRAGGGDWIQGNVPGVFTEEILGQRDLLVPRGDALHHSVIRHRIRADDDKTFVPFDIEGFREGREGACLRGCGWIEAAGEILRSARDGGGGRKEWRIGRRGQDMPLGPVRVGLAAIGCGFDAGAEDDRVVEFQVFGPDPFRALEIMFEVGLLRGDLLFGEFLGVGPGAVVEVGGEPVLRDGRGAHCGIRRVRVDGAVEEVLGFPFGAGDRAVGEFQDEAAVTDVGVVVFHAGFRIRVVACHDGDGHRILGQDIQRDNVVRDERDGVGGDKAPVDVEHEPIVSVDRGTDGVLDAGLFNLRRGAVPVGFAADIMGGGTDREG